MPVVALPELFEHALDQQYQLALVNVPTLALARGAIAGASDIDAPLLLTLDGSDLPDGLAPSLETLARRTPNPVGLLAKRIESAEQAVLAIRLGFNGLMLADDLNEAENSEIHDLARSCDIPIVDASAHAGSMAEIDQELESATLNAVNAMNPLPVSWQEHDATVARAAADQLRARLNELGASDQGQAALETCKTWRPVEHLIIYNTTADDDSSARLAAVGRRVLDKIPGVRSTWTGRAIKADAKFRYCWLVRFAQPAVIDTYREHPDHIAYADQHFRPIAGDRISIDFELTGADENSDEHAPETNPDTRGGKPRD